MGSWPGLSPREEACPGLESELSWEVSWLDMEEPEGRMGALLNRAGEKSLQRERHSDVLLVYRTKFIITTTTASNSLEREFGVTFEVFTSPLSSW